MPTLEQWEKRLQPAFQRKLRMIGEIGLTRPEMEDITTGVRASIKKIGLPRTTQLLFNDYPYTFLSLLTFFSAYNTEYDYWGALAEEIGTERNYLFNRNWHRTYRDKVKALRLRIFDDQDFHKPYVTTIRFHGGIPIYSLGDYFRFIVLPSVDRPELNEVQSDQALQALLQTVAHVDAPVRNFLENSGDLGIEFFEASRKAARHYRQYGVLLSAEEVDLPEHIIESFELFVQEELVSKEKELRTRLRSPVLGFNPYYGQTHLIIRFPEQVIPLRYADGELEWRINWLESPTSLKVPCVHKMHGKVMVIEEQYKKIDACPKLLQISLTYTSPDQDIDSLQDWPLTLMTSGKGEHLIAFHWSKGLLRPGDPLPAEELLLVYPTEVDLQIEGVAHPIVEFAPLTGAWDGWQANTWDLSNSWSVQLLRDGQPVGIPIPISAKLPAPELLGESELRDRDPSGTQLFIANTPTLRVPLRPDMPLHRELDRWRVDIYSTGPAYPDFDKRCQLGYFQSHIEVRDNWADLDLAHLLGQEAVGSYTLCLSGPIDEKIEFRFRLWPKLTLHGMKPALFPGLTGPEAQKLTLRLPENAKCEAQAGSDGVAVNNRLIGWEVLVSSETIQADLNLIWKQPDHEDVWVPVYFSIPRLRWALTLDQDQGEFTWSLQTFHRSLDQILQSRASAIHIEMPGLDAASRLSLELIDVDDTENSGQSESFQNTPFSRDWKRIGLERFAGTLHHNSGLLHFDLSYQATRTDPVVHIPLVLVTRSLDLSEVNLIPIGELSWRIVWKVAYRVKNCWVLLQPAWQPWISPQRFRIPDITAGSMDIEKIGLPSSRYHLHFYISAIEEPSPKRIPQNVQPFDVDLCNPEERLAELEIQLQNAIGNNAYESIYKSIFEMVCIYHDLNDASMRDSQLSKLATPLGHITNLHLILSFYQWLDDSSIESPFANFLYKFMFKPELVEQILSHYHKNDSELKNYFSYVPRVKDIYGKSALMIARVSDDPSVLTTCLRRLLDQEDAWLIPLLIEMIEHTRLSAQDAVDILELKPEWAFNSLMEYQPISLIDSLLGALVERNARLIDPLTPELRKLLILRILPILVDQNLVSIFIRDLLTNDNIEGFQFMMQAQREQKIDRNLISELLSVNPKLAIQTLKAAPPTDAHLEWLEWLRNRFPDKAGLIKSGSKIMTPFGNAIVENIEKISGEKIILIDPQLQDLRIQVYIGEGHFRETAVIDTSNWTIYFPNITSAYQCGHCKFTSPNQRAIQQHHNDAHHFLNLGFRKVAPRKDISPEDIQII
jgi:hypothetical protein